MTRIIAKAALATLASIAASVLIVLALTTAMGVPAGPVSLTLAVVCPLVIAFPASMIFLLQKKKLADALADLTGAHDDLADAHAQLAEAHAQLSEKARHDDMTGLLNRESFFAALKNTRRRADSGVLVIIDADHFKRINDTYGHLQGDDALLLISEAIRKALRDKDIVGRIGGEEFAAFLCGAGAEEAMAVAERIRLAVEAIRFTPQGCDGHLPLSVSIGAARLRPDMSWSDMMREADRRLYEAKRRGRNCIVFEGQKQAAA